MFGITDFNSQTVTALASILTALAAIGGIFFTVRYARATIKQARENSLFELRAYVNVDSPRIYLKEPLQKNWSPELHIALEVSNTGRTPADLVYGTVDYRMNVEGRNVFPGGLLFIRPRNFTSLGSGKIKTIDFSCILDSELVEILKSDRHKTLDLRISLTYTDLFDYTVSHTFWVTSVRPSLEYGVIVPLEGFFSRPENRQINLFHPPNEAPPWWAKPVKHISDRLDWIFLMLYGLLVIFLLQQP